MLTVSRLVRDVHVPADCLDILPQVLVAQPSMRMRMEEIKTASQAVSPDTDLCSGARRGGQRRSGRQGLAVGPEADLCSGAGCGGQRRLPGHLDAGAGRPAQHAHEDGGEQDCITGCGP